ncbi:type II secretion system protein N [Allosphingosinicella flava]|uniref:Type II secretion system protein N n=1 Tax=Allosphingosinicella flava TaxID=2771430 RepID=A0A7T2GHH4_9SPHN|nr:type II secretion system protein N [Sphingosinicella flava]QPQ53999.1 type II secretion system protein N [Sphingosinicella flava]
MRIRLPLGRTLFFLSAFAFATVALLPLRLALDWLGLDERGFAAREAQGSLWLGAISEAQWNGVPLGDLQARLRTLPLLALRARVDLDSPDAPKRVDGGITVTRNTFGVDDLTATLDTVGLLGGLPIARLDLADVTARFDGGTCRAAEGQATATLAPVASLPLPGQMTGTARCDAGALLIPFQSASGAERMEMRLMPGGQYQARVQLLSATPAMAPALTAAGFTATGAGFVLERQGAF